MLNTQEFGDFLHSVGLKDFVGVPCSYLSPLINYAINENRFIMSNNEGDAVAIASGISLGGATYGIVLMQNSGLSNALSPLTSLNHTFKIPILGFVSLRGERDCNGRNTDEPQHELLGIITDKLLETCQVPYAFLDSDMERAKSQVAGALEIMSRGESFFFIVREGTFSKVALLDSAKHLDSNSRHSALSDKSAILHSDFRLRTSVARPQSSLESPDLSSQNKPCAVSLEILECQDSTTLNSKIISESTAPKSRNISESNPKDSKSVAESAIPVIASEHSKAKQSIKQDSEKIDCHEATASRNDNKIESKPHTSLEFPTDSESKNQTESAMDRNSKKLESNPTESHTTQKPLPTRLAALETIHALALKHQALLLATTGKCGRELYEINDTPNQLYMVGSMGCVSALSLGLSLASSQKVIAIDGDSALLMRLGTLSTNAYYARGNFCHILLDNESHDSTGGQFNLSPFVSFPSIAKACGYTNVYEARSIEELGLALGEFLGEKHSACGDFLGSSSPHSLRRMSNTPHSQSSHSPKNSSAILECLAESSPKDSKKVSESTLSDSHSILESKASSYFIYLKIAKGSKDNLGRPKITPQDVAKRLSAYIQEWKQNHAHIESSQNLADTQNKTCANSVQASQTQHNHKQDSKEAKE